MLSTRKPLAQLTTELGLPTSTTEALVAALAEQVRAQLQAEHEAALAQREAEVTAQVTAEVTAEVTARLKAEHFQEMHKLYEQLRLQRRRLFGPSTEASAGQYHLFNEAELACAEQPEACETASLPPAPAAAPTPKARGKRRPLSPELPRLTLVHELPESERLCPCGTPMVEIGREVSEQLDIIPMQVRVLRHERVRYGCPDKSAAPRTAPPPPQVLPRSNASPNLLAMLLTTKYVDGLPLARFGGFLRRSPRPRAGMSRFGGFLLLAT